MADGLEAREEFEKLRLVSRAIAEIARDGLRPRIGVFPYEGFEPSQAFDSPGSIRKRMTGKGLAVTGETGFEKGWQAGFLI